MSTATATSPDTVRFTFEATDRERVSEYDLKLMTIEEEHLAIPDTEYNATLTVGREENIFCVVSRYFAAAQPGAAAGSA